MKNTKQILTLAVVFSLSMFITASAFAQAPCKAKQIASGCKANIKKPFRYDSYAVNEFTFDAKQHEVEVQFTAFQGQKYKVVFCSSGFDEAITMNIFDKSNKIKNNRHKLFDNSAGIDSDFWSFEPAKSGNYFIEYEIPKAKDGKVHKGCIVMLVGYTDPED